MSPTLQHPEDWEPGEGSNDPEAQHGRWRCTLCLSKWMNIHHAIEHENTIRHKGLRSSTQFTMMDGPTPAAVPQSNFARASRPQPARVLGALEATVLELTRDVCHESIPGFSLSQPGETDGPDGVPYPFRQTPSPEPAVGSAFQDLSGEIEETMDEELARHVLNNMRDFIASGPVLDIDSDGMSDGDDRVNDSDQESLVGDDGEGDSEGSRNVRQGRQVRWSQKELLGDESRWFPWPEKIACILDILHHIPRSMFSEQNLAVISWSYGVLGVPTPSRRSMKRVEKLLQALCGVKTLRKKGAFGNVYYVNDLHRIIAQEFSNPLVRKHLHDLPEDRTAGLCEARHFSRWRKELSPDLATPMIRLKNQDFYVFEPSITLEAGGEAMRMPTRWFKRDDQIYAETWGMTMVNQEGWIVDEHDAREVPLNRFLVSFPHLQLSWAERGIANPSVILGCRRTQGGGISPWMRTDPAQGNRWRAKAKGRRVHAFPIWLYCDDTSGNKSKKWNKHNSFLFTPAGLPHDQAHLEYHVHFLCTSNISPPLEMLEGISEQIQSGQLDGIWAWDCETEEPVLLIPSVLAMLGDNPMQSELSCHLGLKAKYFCRCCFVKGKDSADDASIPDVTVLGHAGETVRSHSPAPSSQGSGSDISGSSAGGSGKGRKRKAREEGAQEMLDRVRRFLRIGERRVGSQTKIDLKNIFTAATTVGQKTLSKSLKREKGIKDMFQEHFVEKIFAFMKAHKGTVADRQEKVNELVRTFPQDDFLISPVWRMQDDFDPHQDTPVEILHVILLGFVKYFWRDAMARISAEDKEKVVARLLSVRTAGLEIQPIAARTLVKYSGSLVGRDFRVVAQVAPFVLYDLVPALCFRAWVALSVLIPLVWQPKIDSLPEYLANLRGAINQFLLATAQWTPRWFNKPKFHILLHLPDHIERFGPAILFATESFESFNSPIRSLSINSNRRAPSRDIAVGFGAYSRLRHLLSGGKFVKNWDTHLAIQEIPTDVSDTPEEEEDREARTLIRIASNIPTVSFRDVKPEDMRGVGPDARDFAKDPVLARIFGFPFARAQGPRRPVLLDGKPSPWSATLASKVLRGDHSNLRHAMYRFCKSFELDGHGQCSLGCFIVTKINQALPNSICEVEEMLYIPRSSAAVNGMPSFLLVKVYQVRGASPTYQLPLITPLKSREQSPRPVYALVAPDALVCLVNAQHDCARYGCPITRTRKIRQEREDTNILCDEVTCNDGEDFILNVAQMRSARLLAPFRNHLIKNPTPEEVEIETERAVMLEVHSRKKTKQVTAATRASQGTGLRVSVLAAGSTRVAMGPAVAVGGQ